MILIRSQWGWGRLARYGAGKVRTPAERRFRFVLLAYLLFAVPFMPGSVHAMPSDAIPISKLERATPVDFEQEILPFLKNNCLACHNQTRAKAELVLETPQTILKGSENGAVILPGRGDDSLLVQVAAHQRKPIMPPRENKMAAANLTSEELGLLRLWIDQGAKGEARGVYHIDWQPLLPSYTPSYAVALTADGQFAACSRGNQIWIYHLPLGEPLAPLADAQLSAGSQIGIAHRDVVRTLAFSPDGQWLASGGYREVKLWRRSKSTPLFQLSALTSNVSAIAASSSGKWLGTGGSDGAIRIVELETSRLATVLRADSGPVQCLEFSRDERHLLSASSNRTLRFWDIEGARPATEIDADAEITALCSLEGQKFASASVDGSIRLWEIVGDASLRLVQSKEFATGQGIIVGLRSISSHPDQLISGNSQGALRVWNLANGELVREMNHGGPIATVAVRADGRRLASAGLDHTTKLWALDSGQEIAQVKGDRYVQERLAAARRAWQVATNEAAYSKAAFEAADKERKAQVDRVRKATEAMTAAERTVTETQKKLTDASQTLLTAEKAVSNLDLDFARAKDSYHAAENAVQNASCELKACLAALSEAMRPRELGAGDAPMAGPSLAALEEAVDQLTACAAAGGEAKAHLERVNADVTSKRKLADESLAAAKKQVQEAEMLSKKSQQGRSNAENELNLSITAAQKAAIVVAEAQNTIPLAEAEVNRLETDIESSLKASENSERPIYALAFSPDHRILATAGEDRMVRTWSAETGQGIETYRGSSAPIRTLAFRGARQLAAIMPEGAAVAWDLRTEWDLERVIGTGDASSPIVDRANALAFSPNGKILATGSGEPSRSGQIHLWDVMTGEMRQEFNSVHSDAVLDLDFSPSGKYLASCSADRFMKAIEVHPGAVVKTFEGHTHHVLGVAWKTDGRTLATAGADNVIKLWDFKTGQRKKNVEGFSKEVTSMACFENDQFLVTSGDPQVRLINDKGEQVRAFAGAQEFMHSAAASANGQVVVAGGQDGVLRVWNGLTGAPITQFGPEPPPDRTTARK